MSQHDGATLPGGPVICALARTIKRHLYAPGDPVTALPALSLHRRNAPTDPMPCIYPLSLALTVQGGKQAMMGDRVFTYAPGQAMLTTIDLPAVSHVTRATVQEPYLGLLLKLDVQAIALAASEAGPTRLDLSQAQEAVWIDRLAPALLDALHRLVGLLDDPALLPQLAPLIQQEIIVRLLAGPHGLHLRTLVARETPSQQIARVVAWIKLNVTRATPVEELAANANMSPSTFRQHFRAVTGMSPLQFQKQLRLQEARQLMLNQNMDAGTAARMVGYESASQFSREYNRLFGAPPQRDVRRIRAG